jgi:hypothetical protein
MDAGFLPVPSRLDGLRLARGRRIMRFSMNDDRLKVELEAKECAISESERMKLQDHLAALARSVQDFATAELTITVAYHPQSDVYHAQAKLKLPGQTITTGDYQPTIEPALKRCLDKAVRRVETYKVNPDREAMEQADRRARMSDAVVASSEPDLGVVGKAFQRRDYQAFRNALLGYDEHVRLRVGRWIQRYPEIERELGRSFEIADLVEEVFLLAFERHGERPPHFNMGQWLDELIDPAVKSFYRDPEDRLAAGFAQSLAES